jgi:hypothetical protein
MEHQPLARVPAVVKAALQETADRLGGVELDTVVTAATWAFCIHSEATRRYIVTYFWSRRHSELEAPEPRRRDNSFKEKLHALASYCYAALRRCLAQ